MDRSRRNPILPPVRGAEIKCTLDRGKHRKAAKKTIPLKLPNIGSGLMTSSHIPLLTSTAAVSYVSRDTDDVARRGHGGAKHGSRNVSGLPNAKRDGRKLRDNLRTMEQIYGGGGMSLPRKQLKKPKESRRLLTHTMSSYRRLPETQQHRQVVPQVHKGPFDNSLATREVHASGPPVHATRANGNIGGAHTCAFCSSETKGKVHAKHHRGTCGVPRLGHTLQVNSNTTTEDTTIKKHLMTSSTTSSTTSSLSNSVLDLAVRRHSLGYHDDYHNMSDYASYSKGSDSGVDSSFCSSSTSTAILSLPPLPSDRTSTPYSTRTATSNASASTFDSGIDLSGTEYTIGMKLACPHEIVSHTSDLRMPQYCDERVVQGEAISLPSLMQDQQAAASRHEQAAGLTTTSGDLRFPSIITLTPSAKAMPRTQRHHQKQSRIHRNTPSRRLRQQGVNAEKQSLPPMFVPIKTKLYASNSQEQQKVRKRTTAPLVDLTPKRRFDPTLSSRRRLQNLKLKHQELHHLNQEVNPSTYMMHPELLGKSQKDKGSLSVVNLHLASQVKLNVLQVLPPIQHCTADTGLDEMEADTDPSSSPQDVHSMLLDGYVLGEFRISTAMLKRVQMKQDLLLKCLRRKHNKWKRRAEDKENETGSTIDYSELLEYLPKELRSIDPTLLAFLLAEAEAEIAQIGNRLESITVRNNPHLVVKTLCSILARLLKEADTSEQSASALQANRTQREYQERDVQTVPVLHLLPPEMASSPRVVQQSYGRKPQRPDVILMPNTENNIARFGNSNRLHIVGTQYGEELLVKATEKRTPAVVSGLYMPTGGGPHSMLHAPIDDTLHRRRLRHYQRRRSAPASRSSNEVRPDSVLAKVSNSAPAVGRISRVLESNYPTVLVTSDDQFTRDIAGFHGSDLAGAREIDSHSDSQNYFVTSADDNQCNSPVDDHQGMPSDYDKHGMLGDDGAMLTKSFPALDSLDLQSADVMTMFRRQICNEDSKRLQITGSPASFAQGTIQPTHSRLSNFRSRANSRNRSRQPSRLGATAMPGQEGQTQPEDDQHSERPPSSDPNQFRTTDSLNINQTLYQNDRHSGRSNSTSADSGSGKFESESGHSRCCNDKQEFGLADQTDMNVDGNLHGQDEESSQYCSSPSLSPRSSEISLGKNAEYDKVGSHGSRSSTSSSGIPESPNPVTDRSVIFGLDNPRDTTGTLHKDRPEVGEPSTDKHRTTLRLSEDHDNSTDRWPNLLDTSNSDELERSRDQKNQKINSACDQEPQAQVPLDVLDSQQGGGKVPSRSSQRQQQATFTRENHDRSDSSAEVSSNKTNLADLAGAEKLKGQDLLEKKLRSLALDEKESSKQEPESSQSAASKHGQQEMALPLPQNIKQTKTKKKRKPKASLLTNAAKRSTGGETGKRVGVSSSHSHGRVTTSTDGSRNIYSQHGRIEDAAIPEVKIVSDESADPTDERSRCMLQSSCPNISIAEEEANDPMRQFELARQKQIAGAISESQLLAKYKDLTRSFTFSYMPLATDYAGGKAV